MAVDVVTFGCRLNAYESEAMKKQAEVAGITGDVIIVNTCTVTSEAARQARQTIRKLARERPDAHIVVTGCAAQIDPKTFSEMEGVSLVLGNHDKLQPERWSEFKGQLDQPQQGFGIEFSEKIRVNDIMSVQETAGHMIDNMLGRSRAFIQVQNGCDHRCTFCIIPFSRGNARSVPMGVIIDQIRRLVENGTHEIVLTGVDITSFGVDLPGNPTLGALVQTILRLVPELPRLRISSIDSIEVDKELMDAFTESERLMPHIHLSLQSGSNMILKRMKRRHSREDAIMFCKKIKKLRPDIVFGADIITGFPTETEAMFQESLDIVDECGLTHLHVFPFSPREGTPAARMPQIERDLVKDRAKRLRDKGNMALLNHLEMQKGRRVRILIEKDNSGHCEDFTRVLVSESVPEGSIISASIFSHNGYELLANRIK